MTLTDLANPTKFLALTARVLPWLVGATILLFLIGLYQSATAPDDYQQGATVKIMFIHVPNAWLSMLVWVVMSAAALGTLVWRHPLADAAAILTLVGAINLPIIKFSVDWWNTLHQPASVMRLGGPTLDRAFLIPLLVMAVAFSFLFVTLHLAAMRNEILRRRVRALQMMQVAQSGRRPA